MESTGRISSNTNQGDSVKLDLNKARHLGFSEGAGGQIYSADTAYWWSSEVIQHQSTGNRNWTLQASGLLKNPVIGPDGTVHFIAGNQYVINNPGDLNMTLYAINPDGSEKWRLEQIGAHRAGDFNTDQHSSLAVDKNGSVYFSHWTEDRSEHYLSAIGADGKLLWQQRVEQTFSCPVLDEAGNLYVLGDQGIRSYDPQGELRWTFGTPATLNCPVVGSDGTIYSSYSNGGIYVLSNQGGLLAVYGEALFKGENILLDNDGRLLIVKEGTIYAIQTDSPGPADTWSMKGGNLWHNNNGKDVHRDSDSDNMIDLLDNCPGTANRSQLDTDGDLQGDACDSDDDNDGVPDSEDGMPLDGNETIDTDGDGIGNNTDTDDDGDGVADTEDAFPLDGTETVDTDGDGIGNNADTDDDNDGIVDSQDSLPLQHSEQLGILGWIHLLID